MKAITYLITNILHPGANFERGYAYEIDSYFVHFYGRNEGFYEISTPMTTVQIRGTKRRTLNDWVIDTFGAQNIKPMNLEIGTSIEGVWRPPLFYNSDIFQALNVNKTEMRTAQQALRILIEKLDELFLYIEPDNNGLQTYSHKTRELLILASTEVENFWKYYMKKAQAIPSIGKNFTTMDYVKLVDKLYLKEYAFTLKTYSTIPTIIPFENWSSANSTKSLIWYESYNKTKHDRDSYFSKATLFNCIEAVVANLVMYCVKFGPVSLFKELNTFSSLINQHFDLQLINTNPENYYVYKVQIPYGMTYSLTNYDFIANREIEPFTINPLMI